MFELALRLVCTGGFAGGLNRQNGGVLHSAVGFCTMSPLLELYCLQFCMERVMRSLADIKEFRLNEDSINVTLEAVSQATKCFSFRVVRASVAENLKPSKVHIIDFYDPAHQAQTVS